MKKKKVNESVLDEEEIEDLDSYYSSTVEDSDYNYTLFLGVAALLGGYLTIASIQPTGPYDSPEFNDHVLLPGAIASEVFRELYTFQVDLEKGGQVKSLEYIYTKEELAAYKQLGQELRSHGLLEDPRTIENLAYRNTEQITDKIGLFTNIEAEKAGRLDAYGSWKEQNPGKIILIPWIPAGANTCDECQDLADDGPYPPEDYPEPPHFGCECIPGDPIIIETGDFTEKGVIIHLLFSDNGLVHGEII